MNDFVLLLLCLCSSSIFLYWTVQLFTLVCRWFHSMLILPIAGTTGVQHKIYANQQLTIRFLWLGRTFSIELAAAVEERRNLYHFAALFYPMTVVIQWKCSHKQRCNKLKLTHKSNQITMYQILFYSTKCGHFEVGLFPFSGATDAIPWALELKWH